MLVWQAQLAAAAAAQKAAPAALQRHRRTTQEGWQSHDAQSTTCAVTGTLALQLAQ
jgi:hypothetical protein